MLRIILKIFIAIVVVIVLLFFTFYIGTSGDYKVADTVEQDSIIPHIVIGNAVLHAESFGNDTNEVVIVLHGGPGNDYRYLLDLKALSDDYFIVFYDQRGTGLSPRVPAEELSHETLLADLEKIVDYYAPEEKVNLIGHSYGGMLASSYLGKHPERVNKIVLAEPGMLTSEQAAVFVEKFTPEMSFPLLKHLGKCWFQSLHVKGPDKQARKDYFFAAMALSADSSIMKHHPFSNYFCNGVPGENSLNYWRYSMLSNSVIMGGGMDDNGDFQINFVRGVEKFPGKVLFLSGECNLIIGEEYQREHIKHFVNAEMVVIPDAGHTMFGDQPELSLRAVREYFVDEE